MRWRDEQARLDGCYEKGIEKTVLRMLVKNLDLSTISELILSEKEIKTLKVLWII